MIEKYIHRGEGYNPMLIRDGWQVAQLNYMPLQGLADIEKIDAHHHTDEAFILLEGTAVLLSFDKKENQIEIEAVRMQKGITYNIPTSQWHNIAMDRDAQLIIVEKSDTHLTDCDYYPLTNEQRHELYDAIERCLNESPQ